MYRCMCVFFLRISISNYIYYCEYSNNVQCLWKMHTADMYFTASAAYLDVPTGKWALEYRFT